MINQRSLRYFDWISFFITLILIGIGLLFIYSSTYKPEQPFSIFFKKQLFGIITGLCFYFFLCFKDLRNFARISYFLYFPILGLLVYTILAGWIGLGAKRWISLYFFRGQPSELVKFFLPIFIAGYFTNQNTKEFSSKKILTLTDFFYPLLIIFISFFLIVKQPDLGTGLLILFSGLVMFWFIGIPKKFFIVSGILCVLCIPVFWKILKPYQKNRILVLFGFGNKKTERYQIEQSKIAIGSGGFLGKGFLQGTQNKLEFLPEDHTDFIFSVICEELGFAGALIILLLFSFLIIRLLTIIPQISSFFDQIIAVGLVSHIFLSVCINIGMVIGILPIVGIPLPLFSYGLSNLWITLCSLGWLNNIAIRRFYVG
jgi:rod shape determining protein RodA